MEPMLTKIHRQIIFDTRMNLRLVLLYSLLLFSRFSISAQNLVPNPYFSDTVGAGCPNGQSLFTEDEVAIAKGWSSFGATPDYFNSCGTPCCNVPLNGFGFQNAVSGGAYCGMVTYDDSTPLIYLKDYRELIGAQLIIPLVAGKKYIATIEVSLADSAMSASNNMGISFSTIRYADSNSAPINNHATVYDPAIITQTGIWTTISGSFVADSDYTYVIVGNFFQDDSTKTVLTGIHNPAVTFSYYYVGFVSVVPDTVTAINNVTDIVHVSIYPNPSSGIFRISCSSQIASMQVFDMAGRLVTAYPDGFNKNTGTINLEGKAKGVYLLRTTTACGISNSKLVLE